MSLQQSKNDTRRFVGLTKQLSPVGSGVSLLWGTAALRWWDGWTGVVVLQRYQCARLGTLYDGLGVSETARWKDSYSGSAKANYQPHFDKGSGQIVGINKQGK